MKRTAVNPWPWSVQFGFNQAELVEAPTKWLVCSGQTAIDGDGKVLHEGDMKGQITAALANLATVLGDAGMSLDDVVRITVFTTDVDAFLRAGVATPTTAMTLIGISRLAYPELLVELEAIACA